MDKIMRRPQRPTTAIGLGGAIAVAFVWLLTELTSLSPTPEVTAAFTTIFAAICERYWTAPYRE